VSCGLQLRPVQLQLLPAPGPLRSRVQAALAVHGRPLRWAITAAGPEGLAIEAVVVVEDACAASASTGVTP
jgi:hypothetical protein